MKTTIQSKPNTPGNRHYKYIPKFLLCKQNKLIKNLNFNIHRCVGRSSNTGQITLWHRSLGCKRLYRALTFFSKPSLGVILFSFYDPNRTSFVSIFFDFLTFKFHYILATNNIICGSIIGCNTKINNFRLGFRSSLLNHPNGSIFTAVSLKVNKNPQYALAAGTFCQLIQKKEKFCKIRLPSNQIINVSSSCFGTLGTISNIYHRFINLGKAGRSRLQGKRPHVRGIAMNPVDHPHGGRTNGGRAWVTPWGKSFHCRSTSSSKKKNKK
jgi:large subunit ribosomal protein L2